MALDVVLRVLLVDAGPVSFKCSPSSGSSPIGWGFFVVKRRKL